MMKPELTQLEVAINYDFKNKSLLLSALTHPSTDLSEAGILSRKTYQRLEFLGDSVVSLVVAEILFKAYPEADEGQLAIMQSNLVKTEMLATIATNFNLGLFLIMDRGEEKNGGRQNQRNLENSLEALIGAIYLDSGYEAVHKVMTQLWQPYLIDTNAKIKQKDYKSQLQEIIHRSGFTPPQYKTISQKGTPHQPVFTVQVIAGKHIAEGVAQNKKQAEQNAASKMLALLHLDTA